MTIQRQNNFDGGAAGTALTVANSDDGGSGDILSAVYAPAGCAWTYENRDTGRAAVETMAAANAGGNLGWDNPTFPMFLAVRYRFKFSAGGTWTGNTYLASHYAVANSGAAVRCNTSMNLRIMNRNGFVYPWVGTYVLVPGTEYQLEFKTDATGADVAAVKLWSADGSTLLESSGDIAMDMAMTAAGFQTPRWGASGTNLVGAFTMDDLAQSFDDWVGPVGGGGGGGGLSVVKAWNGSAWIDPSLYQLWDGDSWVTTTGAQVWNGSAWVAT